MPAPTAVRKSPTVAFAVAHQTSGFGSAGSSAAAQLWQVERVEIDPKKEYIRPRGTTGSQWQKDTISIVAQRPTAMVSVLASPKVLPFLWEYALHGQSTATLAGSDLSESGDSGNDLSAWSFTGVRPGFNTSTDWKLYVKLTDESPGAGQALVQVYSDSGRTALVASGSGANSGTITLAEQNSSGLSGTVDLATPSSSNLTGIVLTLSQVRPAIATTISRYFTLWRDHGASKALERLIDCVVQKLTRRSSAAGVVLYDLEIVGTTYSLDTGSGGTFTPLLASGDKEYQTHGTMTLSSDVDSGNVSQHVLSLDLELENDLDVVMANATTPSAIVKNGVGRLGVTYKQRLCDESQVVLARGIAGTYEAVTITDAYSSRTATFVIDKALSLEPKFPEHGDGWADVEHRLEAVEETAGSPTATITITLKL